MSKYVYLFSEGNANMRELLGGKGANLAEMTKICLLYTSRSPPPLRIGENRKTLCSGNLKLPHSVLRHAHKVLLNTRNLYIMNSVVQEKSCCVGAHSPA